MTDTQHDYAPERDPEVQAVLAPTFTQPVFHLNGQPARFDAASYADGRGGPQEPPEAPQTPQTPDEAPAAAPAAPQGPVPALAGTFALFVTPSNDIVLAYRPEGAIEDKRLVVPGIVVRMAAHQTGHQPEDLLRALSEAM